MKLLNTAVLVASDYYGEDYILENIINGSETYEINIFGENHQIIFHDYTTTDNFHNNIQFYIDDIKKQDHRYPIIISTEIEFPNKNQRLVLIDEVKDNIELSKKEYVDEHVIKDAFYKKVIDFIVAVNLSTCGGINILEGRIFQDGKEVKEIESIFNILESGEELAEKIKWPKVAQIPFSKTFNWLKNFHYTIDIVSNSRIGRAVNAFTYLFHDHLYLDHLSDLLWSMVGLEAIYIDGNKDLQSQLNIKSQLILGERTDFKKIVTKLYDYRSRYVHGQLDIRSKYGEDTREYIFELYPEISEMTGTAIAMFVGSLQYFILNDIIDIEYNKTFNINFSKRIK